MAAQHHLQPKQLAMFMPAHEVAALKYGDALSQEPYNREEVLQSKQKENEIFGAPDMDRPVKVFHDVFNTTPTLYDGHHRLAHALDTDPNREMPVEHDDEAAEMLRQRKT